MRWSIKIIPGVKGSNPQEVAGDIEYGNFGVCAAGLSARQPPPSGCGCAVFTTGFRGHVRGKFLISTILATAIAAAVPSQSLLAQPAPTPAPGSADPVQQALTVLSAEGRASEEQATAAARRL